MGTAAAEAPSQGGSEMDFFDNLTSAASPAPAKTVTKAAAPARPSTARPAPAKASAKASAVPAATAASRAAASRAKKKNDQMMLIYLGGGIGAAILLALLAILIMSSGGGAGSSGGGGKKKDDTPPRFGMTGIQRKRFFESLLHAADENGPSKECRNEWVRLGREKNLSDQQISEVFKEGMDADWEQPAIPATVDQKQKTNRHEWVLMWNQTHRDPIMSQ
ncbi:MAG: hypothetical protein ABSH20_32110 [Tepidisphaeraceae bacterium]